MKLTLIEKDTKPLRGEYRADGAMVDLSGYAVSIKLGYAVPLVKAATILNQVTNKGEYEFPWLATDLVLGTVSAQVMITNPSGQVEHTDAFDAEIGPRIAP